MKRHLSHHHTKYFADLQVLEAAKKKVTQPMITTAFKKNELCPQEKKALFLQAVTSWVVKTSQPFTVVESAAFRQMFDVLDKAAPKIVRNVTSETVRERIQVMGRYSRAAIELALRSQHVSWTSDYWTGPNDKTYTTTTGHFIDK